MNIFSKTLKVLTVVGAFSLLLASCSCGGTDSGTPQGTGSSGTTEWKISYSTEYGTAPASKSVEDGYKLVAGDLPTLSADGFVFGGWNKSVDFEIKADTTITAVWAPIGSYAITYNLNGGTNAASNPSSFRESEAVTLADPTRAGCTFKGWYAEEDYSGTAISGWSAGEKTANVELYAKWRIDISLDEVKVTGTTFTGSDANKLWTYYTGAFTAARTITVKDYYIGKYELTKDQYKAIMSDTGLNTLGVSEDPSYSTSDPTKYKIADGETDGKRAVEGVTWYDAVYYCNLLSRNDGLTEAYTITSPAVSGGHITSAAVEPVSGADGWRLPTEIEWEFAARGGKPSEAAWNYEYAGADSSETSSKESDAALDSVGWYLYNTCNGGTTGAAASSGTAGYGAHQVGMKNANSLGLYDMSGNVFEWCWDWYGTIDTTTPLAGPSSGSRRVHRGGSWIGIASSSCVAYRNLITPDSRYYFLGFRLVRSAQ